jgi:hypothetical protein
MALIVFFVIHSLRITGTVSSKEATKRKTSEIHEIEKHPFLFNELDWTILLSNEMQSYLLEDKLEAIKLYQEVTGVTHLEAKEAIDHFVTHTQDIPASMRHNDDTQGQISRMRELLRQGKRTRAREMYQDLTGADQLEVLNALDQLEKEARIEQERFEHLRNIVDKSS